MSKTFSDTNSFFFKENNIMSYRNPRWFVVIDCQASGGNYKLPEQSLPFRDNY